MMAKSQIISGEVSSMNKYRLVVMCDEGHKLIKERSLSAKKTFIGMACLCHWTGNLCYEMN